MRVTELRHIEVGDLDCFSIYYLYIYIYNTCTTEYVTWLEVPMTDSMQVEIVYGIHELFEQLLGNRLRVMPQLLDVLDLNNIISLPGTSPSHARAPSPRTADSD